MTTYTGGTGITVDNVGNIILVDNTVVTQTTDSDLSGNINFTGNVDFTSASVTGAIGYTGSAGATGFTGSASTVQGPQGFAGSQGNAGADGAQGNIGFTGSIGIGFTGSQGVRGYTGSRGTTGFVGSKGDIGFAGSRGFDGSVGFTGSAGFTGSISTTPGPQGNIGFTGSDGPQGPTGFTGSQGFIGYAGSTGYTGSIGPQGPMGPAGDGQNIDTFRTIRIVDNNNDTTNIIADQSEDVVTFKAGNNIDLNVTVDDTVIVSASSPQGPQGDIGFTGSQGYTGSQGLQGIQGYQGTRGFDGSFGRTGSQGFTGSQGYIGYTGSQGSIGYTGSAGLPSTVPGYTGSIGERGPTGITGSQGEQGQIGFTGSRGFEGSVGFTGSKGFTGFTGSQGTEGPQGVGFTGSRGFVGSQGVTGFNGSTGFTGSKGIQGIQGLQGIRGYTGSRGLQGAQGTTGLTGSRGFAGSTGYTGSRGAIGPQGQQGIPGFTGSKGDRGSVGPAGPEAEAFRTFRHFDDTTGLTDLIIADQTEDVMTFVSGRGILIDFNSATDTITFAVDGNISGGGGGNSIVDINVVNNDPADTSFIEWDSDTQVLSYTPIDISDLAETQDVITLFRESKDYTNALVLAEQTAREEADQDIYTYVNENITRLEQDLASNVIILTNYTDTANVYLQGLIEDEANIRANADIDLQIQIDSLTSTAANILLDLDANVDILQQELQQIEANSIARDNQLQSNIDVVQENVDVVSDGLAQEILDRIAGDDQLQTNINDVQANVDIVAKDLIDETNSRIANDWYLEGLININETAIDNVAGNLAQEIIDRELGDEALQTQITLVEGNITILDNRLDQEILDRIAGDQQLQANLDLEVDVINGQLDLLSNAIQNEANIRANADSALSDKIDIERIRNDVQDVEIDDLDIRVEELESKVTFSIDYEATLTNLGNVNTSLPTVGNFIPLNSSGVVIDDWSSADILKMNAVDDEGTFHFLDSIGISDDLVFQHRTQNSYCRMEVTGNVVLQTVGNTTYADIGVSPIAFNGVIVPGDGSANTLADAYLVNFYPNVAGDVPSYDYVDSQDNRRVLKAGDTMTGSLIMKGGDVVAYGNAGSSIKAVEGADVTIDDTGSLIVSGTGSVSTNKITNVGGSSINLEYSGSGRLQIASSGTYFLNKPAKYTNFSANGVGNDQFDLIHKGYLDTRINNLDLANTYVFKSGDVMSGTLSFNPSTQTAIKINPTDGSLTTIDLFKETNTQLTAVDIRLIGNTSENRFRILGGENNANTLVAWTARGDFVTNVPMDMNNNKITSVGNPIDEQDAVNFRTLTELSDTLGEDLDDKVSKTGGDSMEGPLNIQDQPGVPSRTGRRINTLGVYSNSDSSSLQLGAMNTTIYVGNNDTSFNGPIKVQEIQERNSGQGVYILAPLNFGQQTNLMNIPTASGTTQNINLFGANTTGETTLLKFNVNGATFNNAIEFESGPSGNKETVLRIDSNRGIRARNLRAHNGGSEDVAALDIGTENAINLSMDGLGKMSWGTNSDASLYKDDKKHISLITRSNGTPQTTFDSWMYIPNTGIQLGENYGTQVSDGFIYMDSNATASDARIELVNGAYIATSRIRPSPANFSDGINLFGDVTFDFGPGEDVMKINRSSNQVEMFVPTAMSAQLNMNGDGSGRNKIINLATPTSDYHAANKKYVDDNLGSDAFIKNGGTTILSDVTHIKAGSSGKWMNIQAATNSGTGFFVMRNYEGDTNLFQVNGDGTVLLSAGRMASNEDEVTTKRYVDKQVSDIDGFIKNGGTTILTETTHIKAASNGKWMNIQAATNSGTGFFVFRDFDGNNLLQVQGDGILKLKAGKMATDLDEITTKRYVDSKLSGGGGTPFPGRRFKFAGYGKSTGVNNGEFSPENSTDLSQKLYISIADQDGMKILEASPDFTPGISMGITVYNNVSGTWKAVGFATWGGSRTDYRGGTVIIPMTWKQKPTLTSGAIYAIVVSGRWG